MFDVIIVGGGIAGLQAAIQLGRYKHQVLVLDGGHGRSTLSHSFHNVLGYPEGVSGNQLRALGQRHAKLLGVTIRESHVHTINKSKQGFEVITSENDHFVAGRLLLATGVMDRFPPFPDLYPCLGITVYVCPDCDGYEVRNKKTMVLGAGDAGANMALGLTYWTKNVVLINHEQKQISEELTRSLKKNNIEVISMPIAKVLTGEAWEFAGVNLADGRVVNAERAFLAFGGNEVKSELAEQLGVERLENKHIIVDPRTKMTNVKHVWAAGDVVAHSEQVTIAMGEGSQAAIWIHKSLL